MRRARIMLAVTTMIVFLLTFAPAALAHDDGGQGWWGETTDSQITSIMFGTIAFFPTVILVFSLIQWRLDKRRHAREDAVKARQSNADWRGGW
jgi:protein-S-isoprenylcysteine O-methyltransferase Ste14